MNRLQQELQRLYGPQADNPAGQDLGASGPADAPPPVRAMVLALARPADWAALSVVWRGVQADLALPAPAIAVNGSDGFQLWFSLVQAVPAPQAEAFLDALRRRWLGDTAPARVAMLPAPDGAPALPPRHAQPVPALQAGTGQWSAFVAPDLAPMLADEPWLDMAPSADGQAQLLASLASMLPADFEQALQQLMPAAAPSADASAQATAWLDPRQFLLGVMNDHSLDLALRIEAAKALLPLGGPATLKTT